MGKASQVKGDNFENRMAERLQRQCWPGCYPSADNNLFADHNGVDLQQTGNFNVQLKCLDRAPAYWDILSAMPKNQNKNVVIHQRKNNGILVIMKLEDFTEIVRSLNK